MSATKERKIDLSILEGLTLLSGSHSSRSDGVCAMEAAAWVAGQPHSDHPPCVSPIIGAFIRSWNDGIQDAEERTRIIKPLIPGLLNTVASKEIEERRAFMAMDWLIRVFTPEWLDLCSDRYAKHTATLRALPAITSWDGLIAATPILVAAKTEAAAAWAAARDAARDAAWAAAWAAARAAAWDAATAAARAAARDAAWAAAWAAAQKKLAPIKEKLQGSAAELVKRMCEAA